LHINNQQPSLLVGVFINGLTNYGQLVMQAPKHRPNGFYRRRPISIEHKENLELLVSNTTHRLECTNKHFLLSKK
jgi:hypothetical protein